MEKEFSIKKMFGIVILSSILLIPMSIATAGDPPGSGWHVRGPAIIAEMIFTPTTCTVTASCQGSVVDIVMPPITPGVFVTIDKVFLLDQYLSLGNEIFVYQDGVTAIADCVPEDAVAMVAQGVLNFVEDPDGSFKTAKVILLFVVPQ